MALTSAARLAAIVAKKPLKEADVFCGFSLQPGAGLRCRFRQHLPTGERPMQTLTLRELRAMIFVAPQVPALLGANMADAIAFGARHQPSVEQSRGPQKLHAPMAS